MRILKISIALLLLLAACSSDESVTGSTVLETETFQDKAGQQPAANEEPSQAKEQPAEIGPKVELIESSSGICLVNVEGSIVMIDAGDSMPVGDITVATDANCGIQVMPDINNQ